MKISFKVFFYSEWHIGKETFDARAQKEKKYFFEYCRKERDFFMVHKGFARCYTARQGSHYYKVELFSTPKKMQYVIYISYCTYNLFRKYHANSALLALYLKQDRVSWTLG
jgi:hypothetical protein